MRHAVLLHPEMALQRLHQAVIAGRGIDDLANKIKKNLSTLAVERSDFPVIKAVTIYVAMATMVFNLVGDLLYKLVDPRVRIE